MTLSHDQPEASEGSARRTLAVRLEVTQHAQLAMIAQLEQLTITEAIRQAIDQWIEVRRGNPELLKRAEAVLQDIEREAASRKGALSSLLGGSQTATVTTDQSGSETPTGERTPKAKGVNPPRS